jgi:hypothetical protein
MLLAEPSRKSSKEIAPHAQPAISRSDIEILKLALTVEALGQMTGDIPDDGSIGNRYKARAREQRPLGVVLAAEVCGHARVCWTG